jgi:hypothetical protein
MIPQADRIQYTPCFQHDTEDPPEAGRKDRLVESSRPWCVPRVQTQVAGESGSNVTDVTLLELCFQV